MSQRRVVGRPDRDPGQFHGLTIPSYQRDRLSRYLAWYDRYLKSPETGPTTVQRD